MNDDIWSQALKIASFDSRIDKVYYNTIMTKIKQVSYEDDILILSCRDDYSLNLIKGQELETYIKNAVTAITERNTSIKYVIEGDTFAAVTTKVSEAKVREKERNSYPSSDLTSEYTFDNFIVGDCNRFAYASAFSVAENPGMRQKNPLYLWGNSGLGKTHLMKAIGYKVKQLFPNKKILFTTCEEFVNAYVFSLKNENYESFRNKYRNVDVLLIDDIQFLINKIETQKEFFNTFETLISSGKQIVITCDKSPKMLPELDPRLTSRFQSGTLMDIQPPDYETRKAIFLKNMESSGIHFSDDIVEYICENVTDNIRDLNGAFNTLSSYYVLENGNIDLDMVVSKFSPIFSPGKKNIITVETVIDAVSKYYDIAPDKMVSKLKSADIVNARSVAMYICRDLLELPFEKIGESFGGKKHTSVMHAINKVTENDALMSDVKIIEKKLADV